VKPIRFLTPASIEHLEAVAYYDGEREGLGAEFEEEVKQALGRILEHPEAWPPLSRRTRRGRTKRFPYGIVYQDRGDFILVVAVMHLHRNPRLWRARLTKGET